MSSGSSGAVVLAVIALFDAGARVALADPGAEYRETLLGTAALPIGVLADPRRPRAYVAVSGGDAPQLFYSRRIGLFGSRRVIWVKPSSRNLAPAVEAVLAVVRHAHQVRLVRLLERVHRDALGGLQQLGGEILVLELQLPATGEDVEGVRDAASGAQAGAHRAAGRGRRGEVPLGIEGDGIKWEETVSENREPFLQNNRVDLVIASYSITDDRREVVGQAGPYYVTGQQLLVRSEDAEDITSPEDTEGKKVCSVTGSTSLQRMEDEYGASPVPFATYSECVDQLENGTVDAVTTDGAILLGYAAENPDELEVVGEPFSEERYGVGYNKDATEMCQWITDTLQAAMDDGTWAEAFEATLGESGVETPEPPAMAEVESNAKKSSRGLMGIILNLGGR